MNPHRVLEALAFAVFAIVAALLVAGCLEMAAAYDREIAALEAAQDVNP